MLKSALLHPEILQAIAAAGHGSQILIADGNYPVSTGSNPAAKKVYLNLAPVEAAHVMQPASGADAPIFAEFSALLNGLELQRLGRFEFYAAASAPSVCLAIATGEQRIYANILLTIGVVPPPTE
jgi:L-fucose mutarotase